VNGRRRAASSAVALTLLVLGTVSFARSWAAVRDLAWPGLDIQYRELAAAQTILDQGYGADPTYLNERVWYNPMAAWAVVGLSNVTHVSPRALVARAGPIVNFVTPAALFVLVAVLFDAFAGVAAVAAFIFATARDLPFTYAATYSPWFAPENFGQGFLYLALVAAYFGFRPDAAVAWSVLAGALLGVTFLTHTAPAIIGGLVFVGAALALPNPASVAGGRTRVMLRVGVALGVAFVVSLPFARHILGHYHLRIVNDFPSQSPSDLLDLNDLPATALKMITLPAIVALVALARRAASRPDRGTRFFLVWVGAVSLPLVLHVCRLLLGKAGVVLPAVVPAFHFFCYATTLVAVGFGVGLRDLSVALADRLARRRFEGNAAAPLAPGSAPLAAGLLACGLALACAAVYYPRYTSRDDFASIRADSVSMNRELPTDVIAWIRAHTSPDDVFLCTDDASLYLVAPAGRKVVATNRYFSNPYVDWAARDADRRLMFTMLGRGDVDGFSALARKYRVGYVLISADRSPFWLEASGMRASDLADVEPAAVAAHPGFRMAFRNDRFAIVAIGAERVERAAAVSFRR
jgi:hypothetical protein